MWRTKWAISEFWKKKTAFFFRQTDLVARDKGAFNRCCHIPLHAYIYAACTPINAQEHLVLQDHNPRMLDVLYKYPILHCDASHLWDIHEVWTIFRPALRSRERSLPVFVYALPTGMQEFSSLYPFFWPWLCWHYSDAPCFLLLWSLSSDHIPLSAVLKWIQSLKFHLLINAKCICVIKQRVDNQSHDQLFS